MATKDVLEELIKHRGNALVAYAYLLFGNRAVAQDLVQDALVKVLSRSQSHSMHVTENYVRGAIATIWLDQCRRNSRWLKVKHLFTPRTAEDETIDRRPDQDLAGATVDAIVVHEALEHLAPRERTCVVLKFYQDLTVAQIAETLDLSEGTVKRYLSDGQQKLASILGAKTLNPITSSAPRTLRVLAEDAS